jgi:type I restriction enzyme S subunit
LDAWYLNYVMNTELARKHSAKVLSVAVGQANINAQKLRTYPIPLPPTLDEQRAIANALKDVDRLLDGLDELTAKKRDLRVAVMQQLLSGKTRLPGFDESWTERQLGELGVFVKGSGIKKAEASSGGLPCVRYGELYTHHDDVVRRFYSSISPAVAATARRLQQGDLVFAGSGETKEEIGKCAAFTGDFEAYAGGDIVILRNHGQDPAFMGYACNTPLVIGQKSSRAQGDTVVHISARALADIVVRLPSLSEQRAIVRVLEDSDAEIAAIERRRAKTQNLKLAMMQELLSGRTRLVSKGGSDA